MNNSEFLWGLMNRADGSLQAWFDAEHVEGTNGIDGETNGIADGSPLVDELGEITNEVSELMKKQPYTFDVNDVQGSIRLAGRYIDELTAERDEWKAKAEAKSAKRAAAAERVRKAKDAGTSIGYAIVGCEYYPWEAYETLIDLLTDEPMDVQRDSNGTCPDAMGQSSDAPTLDDLYGILGGDCGHSADMSEKSTDCVREGAEMSEEDSREKLEADVLKHYTHTTSTLMWPDDANIKTKWVSASMDNVLEWLDRQASITERDVRTYLNREDSELIQAKVDNLQRQIEHLREEIAKRDNGIERLKRQRDEVRAKLENLARDLAECSREREAYRRACGELLDYADQMRLVSLDGCGATLVDGRGEVVS